MSDWPTLEREFDLWAVTGATPTLWWRDDDAVAATPALVALKSAAGAVPLALAVIPAADSPAVEGRAPPSPEGVALAEAVAGWPGARVVVHGYGHRNHAGATMKKSEFPAGRDVAAMRDDLSRGLTRLGTLFGPRLLAVLVPPWNRIADALLPLLPGSGFRGLSRFSEPPYPRPRIEVPGLREVNTHVDVVDWRGTWGFAGEAACLGRLAGHLAARRLGRAADLPTGILTHHLVHDAATWRFLANLQDWLARRPGGDAERRFFVDPAENWPQQ